MHKGLLKVSENSDAKEFCLPPVFPKLIIIIAGSEIRK